METLDYQVFFPDHVVEGPCLYCDQLTSDNRVQSTVDGTIWFHHTRCYQLWCLKMEDVAMKKVQQDPHDKARQAILRAFTEQADRALLRS